MSEHDEQAALIEWADTLTPRYPRLAMLFAIPNGGHRAKAVARRMQAEGIRRGVPDLCLPLPGAYGPTLWIEMKRPGGRLSMEQQWWRAQLQAHGHGWIVAYSWPDAAREICRHLSINPADAGLSQEL